MGGHSSDSEDSHYKHKSKKHKKRRSRSRSHSSDESKSHRKHKKSSKKSKHSRSSRSRSSERSHKSRSSRRSRSRSKSPYSSRHRRSRSRSRSRRSPKSRRRSRSRSKSRRSRSGSKSRISSHSRSVSRRSTPDSLSRTGSLNIKSEKGLKVDPCADIPGFEHLPPAKQAELRLQMALKAAAVADQKLQNQGLLVPLAEKRPTAATSTTVEQQQKRLQDIDDIEQNSFEPAMFKSSRTLGSGSKNIDTSHSDAIFGGFGGGGISIIPTPVPSGKSVLADVNELFGPIFYVSQEERMERWKKKLMSMRRKKLEGVAMT